MTALANGCPQQPADTLPAGASFLVVIAEEPVAVPRVEERLRTIGVASVWQELPGAQLGVLSLRPRSLPRVVDLPALEAHRYPAA
ncbi:hypothetical protein OG555_32730 [Kribbella sp. NBC_01484]|uniref:hypothetical protein n=1 Tax=Kribbella sp. NBC_01484 TaxID=2903579 RepID=UPI002E38161D|nr:hypothetical protein [Kribbella sp. NBC_01484]